jgi:branched-chain amino acid transport system substrate-binding protein
MSSKIRFGSKQQRPRRQRAAVLVVATALVAAGCASGAKAATTSTSTSAASATQATGSGSLPSTIQIAGLTSMTGSSAISCLPEAEGMKLAVAQANAQKLFKNSTVQINVVDDQSTPEAGVTGFQQIASQNPAGLVGLCLSNVADAVIPLVDSAKMPLVITTAAGSTLVDGKYRFRGEIPQTAYAGETIDYLAAHGVKTIGAVYSSSNPTVLQLWNSVMKPRIQKDKMKVVYEAGVSTSVTDFTAEMQKLQPLNPGAIANLETGALVTPLQNQIRGAGLNQPVFGQLSMGSSTFIKTPSAVGSVFAQNYAPVFTYPSSMAFTKAFEAAYNSTPTGISAGAYDATWRLLNAIASAHSVDHAAVASALRAQTTFAGAQGPLKFTANGDVTGPGGIVKILAGGKLKVVTK